MLGRIEKACLYAERFDRKVLVETDFPRARTFQDSFAAYFHSRNDILLLKSGSLDDFGDLTDIFPPFVRGRLNTYRAVFDKPNRQYRDRRSGESLRISFDRDYPQRVLLYHDIGGGASAMGALKRMRIGEEVAAVLMQRWRQLGPGYAGLHIRNTDIQADYEQPVSELAGKISGPVFVATDNRTSLDYCREVFGDDRVISFARLPEIAGLPLHQRKAGVDLEIDVRQRNVDSITDLLLLALSDRCYAFALKENRLRRRLSGFSRLALDLWSTPSVVADILSGTSAAGASRVRN